MALVFENKKGEKELRVFKYPQNLYWALCKYYSSIRNEKSRPIGVKKFAQGNKVKTAYDAH